MRKLFILFISLTLSLLIFFLTKIAQYENTLLQLNKNTKIERDYRIFNDDTALFILNSNNLEYSLYIKELKKINEIWVGKAYNYKEVYQKNFGFQWLEDDFERNNSEYNRKKKEIEYNKNVGYFLIDNEKESYGLSEEEIKKILDSSSLKLKNPEKYMKRNGERQYLTQFNQNLFGKILNFPIIYGSNEFEKGNTATAFEVNKLIFIKNLIIIYLDINLILCITFLFKKNTKNIGNYIKTKIKRILVLCRLDFFTLFLYCFFSLFSDLYKIIEISKFIFYYIIIKNFLLYYYLKLRRKKFRRLIRMSYLILISVIFIENIKINSIFYYLIYIFSVLCFPVLSFRKKENLENIVSINSLYLIIQLAYLAIVFLWIYIIF